MMKNILWIILAIAITTGSYYIYQKQAVNYQRVLVIHSYQLDLAWVQEINDGISKVLDNQNNIKYRMQYMDLKNNNQCSHFRSAAREAHHLINTWEPDVLIIADDLGQALIGSKYITGLSADERTKLDNTLLSVINNESCDSKQPDYLNIDDIKIIANPDIVFLGVNGSDESYGYQDANNVYGVFEHKNYELIKSIAHELKASSKTPINSLYIFNDTSTTALSEKEGLHAVQWGDFGEPKILYIETFSQWIGHLQDAENDQAMIMIPIYKNITNDSPYEKCNYIGAKQIKDYGPVILNDSDKVNCNVNDLITYTELNYSGLIFGASTNYIFDGGMINVALTGREHGKLAAQYSLDWISNTKNAKNRKYPNTVILGFNKALIKRKQLQETNFYKENINDNSKFYDFEQYFFVEKHHEQ